MWSWHSERAVCLVPLRADLRPHGWESERLTDAIADGW